MTRGWSGLGTRIASAIVMLITGGAAILVGGVWFALLVSACVGLMLWELCRMMGGSPMANVMLGVLGAIVLGLAFLPPDDEAIGIALARPLPMIVAVPAMAGAIILAAHRWRFALYSVAIVTACAAMIMFREAGIETVSILLAIVIATDVAGYFAGRLIGGPRVWPRISPGKTWSGTVAGWIAAASVVLAVGGGLAGAAFGLFLSFASQMGDAAESALKRKMGVKDSSDLIPGHGGLMDRFDGLVGAALAMLFLQMVGNPMQFR